MDTVFYVVAATEGLGLSGAIGAVALLRGRIGRLEARASDTVAQMMAVAMEVQQMATAVTARLSEQQQSLDASPVKPRRGMAVAATAEVLSPPALLSMQVRTVERVAYERESAMESVPYEHQSLMQRPAYEREPSPRPALPHAAERLAAPVSVRSVRATLDASGPEVVMSDQDLARERGMDPLGVALQRQLVGHAVRTA